MIEIDEKFTWRSLFQLNKHIYSLNFFYYYYSLHTHASGDQTRIGKSLYMSIHHRTTNSRPTNFNNNIAKGNLEN